MDAKVQRRMEGAFGADFTGVSVHTGPASDRIARSISARSFTVDREVHFRNGEYRPATRDGQRLLAHELTHVLQQGGATVRRAADESAPAHAVSRIRPSTTVVRRNYAGLSQQSRARVDQQAEQHYYEKAAAFEIGMAPVIMSDGAVNTGVDQLVNRVKAIVDAWAAQTGVTQQTAYEREFGWRGGDRYFGAFEMTGANIQAVLNNLAATPMRTRLKIVYNAVRNNNLQKWLKVAALELDRTARNRANKDRKIKTATGAARTSKGKFDKANLRKETVQHGFAHASGLDAVLAPQQISQFAKQARSEKKTTGTRSKRDVFGHDRFSAIADFAPAVAATGSSRRGRASGDLPVDDQRTLKRSDVGDLTDDEVRFLLVNQQVLNPSGGDVANFKNDANAKIRWEQGSEFYDVIPTSTVAREAAALKMRLEAGVSGSTDLMLHASKNLGITAPNDLKLLRLALAGWMMANRDHSFFEVYKAAEAYGVMFVHDPAVPGAEYEVAGNLHPMGRNDFTGVLPGGLFPAHYLSGAYKDTLANNLAGPGRDAASFNRELIAQGISDEVIAALDDRGRAEVARLSEVVETSQFTTSLEDERKKNQIVRRIRHDPAYLYLARAMPASIEKILKALLRAHHGGQGLLPQSQNLVDNLADAGVPRYILDTLKEKDVKALEAVRIAVKGATVAAGVLQTAPIDQAWLRVPAAVRNRSDAALIRSVMTCTYHGDAVLNDDQKLHARAAQLMAGREEGGVKKLAANELNALSVPRNAQGNVARGGSRDYWDARTAQDKADPAAGNTQVPALLEWHVGQMDQGAKGAVVNAMRGAHPVGSPERNEFERIYANDLMNLGQAIVATAQPADIQSILPTEAYESWQALQRLDPKELGAITRYTGALYKPLVRAANTLATSGFTDANLTNMNADSPLATLTYMVPLLEGISSGLSKLPVYSGTVYRISESGSAAFGKSASARKTAAKRWKPGKIESQRYPMSASKTLRSQFLSTHYNQASYDTIYEIRKLKSGRDIQVVSDKFTEEEVLFPPGSRLKVVSVHPVNPHNPADLHIWIVLEEV